MTNGIHILYNRSKTTSAFSGRVMLMLLLLGFAVQLSAAPANEDESELINEISITLNVQRIGTVELPAVIYNEKAYLPIKDLFDFLRIKNTLSAALDSSTGFFIDPKAIFLVDKSNNRIVYNDKSFTLQPDHLIKTETNLYLRSDYFGEVFGLECTFNFRSLSVSLVARVDLPAIREMQQEQMRRNISRLKGEKKADTTLRHDRPWLNVGMADWSIVSTQQTNSPANTRLNLNLGGVIAGGEANISLNYNSNSPFNKAEQHYRWRYVNNDNALLRQVSVGKIAAQSVSTINSPVIGFQLTNTPTTYRRSFGTYMLSNTTQPGWLVELYINNVLVNYTRADASGFYTFEVPMVYGNSEIKLRFYGPWGEEYTTEQNLNIPYNFVPLHQLEYNLAAGFLENEPGTKFSRAQLNYGLSKRISLGGGVEYLSRITNGNTMPFVIASARILQNLIFSAEATVGVRTKASLNYRLPNNLQLDVNYTRYQKEQTAVLYNYFDESKAILTMPIRTKNFNSFTRLTLNQYRLGKQKNTTGEFLFSSLVHGVNANLTTTALLNDPKNPNIHSSLSLNYMLPKQVKLTQQLQYGFARKSFTMVKWEAEKNVFRKGYVNLSFDRDFYNKRSYIGLGFRYNFSFAQTSVYTRNSKDRSYTSQSARGSILYNPKGGTVSATEFVSVGKAALIVSPFLDMNCNGIKDKGEPKVAGLHLRVSGARTEKNTKDTTIQITGLEAYNNYLVELDKNSFDNISWQLKHKTIGVSAEPNYFKIIEVPVSVVGEVAGTVLLRTGDTQKGLGRVIVKIFDSKNRFVAQTLSEADGYFSYLGLAPGSYTATVDAGQLKNLQFELKQSMRFAIKAGREGDVVDNIELLLEKGKEQAD